MIESMCRNCRMLGFVGIQVSPEPPPPVPNDASTPTYHYQHALTVSMTIPTVMRYQYYL